MNGRVWSSITVVAAALGCGDGDDGGGTSVTTDPQCNVKDQNDGSKLITWDDGTTAIVRDGVDGTSCTVADNGDGTKSISCTDGTMATVTNGAKGDPGTDGKVGTNGTSCTVRDNGDGTKTISCSDGTTVVVADGAKGDPGLAVAGPCPTGVIDGSYTIENAADALSIADCTTISADLIITALTSLSLPALTTVGGHLRCNNFANNTALTSLSLPMLATIGQDLDITNNPKLPTSQATAIRNQLVNFTGTTTIIYNLP